MTQSNETARIAELYTRATAGQWDEVMGAWRDDSALARRCSRFVDAGTGWTFLHHAAFAGEESASRQLIALGAYANKRSREGKSASDGAALQGHADLTAMLAFASHVGHLWEPPSDPDLLPGSNLWKEAREIHVSEERRVAYGGGVVTIPAGARCYEDGFGRTLIGWHGTYDPPSGMDGDPMI
jgi:hypothetical protein